LKASVIDLRLIYRTIPTIAGKITIAAPQLTTREFGHHHFRRYEVPALLTATPVELIRLAASGLRRRLVKKVVLW